MTINDAMQKIIHGKNLVGHSYEHLYHCVHQLTLKAPSEVYSLLKQEIPHDWRGKMIQDIFVYLVKTRGDPDSLINF